MHHLTNALMVLVILYLFIAAGVGLTWPVWVWALH